MYSKALTTLDHILVKGSEFAKAKGVSADDMLEWRLVDDMNPLRFQAYVVINFSKRWTARVAGAPEPDEIAADLNFDGLRAAIAEAKTLLAALKPEQFAGRDDVLFKTSLGPMEPEMPLGQWLTGFVSTNVYFHLSMAYAILRARGVQIGKIDLFAGGL